MKKIIYEIWLSYDKKWEACVRAEPQPSGWLHYQLRDGTNGLARPEKWRIKPIKKGVL